MASQQNQQTNPAELNKQEEDYNANEPKEETKYINPEYFNDDVEESEVIEKMVLIVRPYFSQNNYPTSKYLQHKALPLIYEALSQVDKKRPKEPIEFFAAYLLNKNK